VCRSIRCIRYGFFGVDHALLLKHVNLENVLKNLAELKSVIRVHRNLWSPPVNIRTPVTQIS
jgi:hypothetical protein